MLDRQLITQPKDLSLWQLGRFFRFHLPFHLDLIDIHPGGHRLVRRVAAILYIHIPCQKISDRAIRA